MKDEKDTKEAPINHRQKTVFYQKKFEKGNGEQEYDNEDYGEEEEKNPQDEDEEDEEALDFLSIQPYELYSNVMNPMKRELDKFLRKDEEYFCVFKNEMIKR